MAYEKTLYIDESGNPGKTDGDAGKKYQKNLLAYLRKSVGGITRGNFRLEDSKKNDGIQLADIIAGAIRRRLLEKRNSDDFFSKVEGKVVTLKSL